MINPLRNNQEFEQAFPLLPIKYDVGWHEVTSLGVGGEIPVLVEPTDDISLVHLLHFCSKRKIPVLTLGGGTNLAGMDEPFPGLVLRLSQNDFVRIKIGRNHVTAGAGVRLSDLVNSCAKKEMGGIAPLIAIPGTVGGALFMNAGARGVTIGDITIELCGFDLDGNPWSAAGSEIKWGYRSSSIPGNVIITGAIFALPAVDREQEMGKIRNELNLRRANDPKGRSCGCVFKNISPCDQAGRLIDVVGGKGRHRGKINVSQQHANYFINSDHASEADFIDLVCEIRESVAKQTGFYLTPEVCFANPDSKDKVICSLAAPKVAVLKGGTSSERDVSLQSGAGVANALRNAGYDVAEIDVHDISITDAMRAADVVFPVLHGGFGENGEIQKALEDAKLRFVGSGSNASAIIVDKIKSKQLMERFSIPTSPWAVIDRSNRRFPHNLSCPVIVKPPREGSTVGIVIVENEEHWESAIEKAFQFDDTLLVEKFIDGIETTVGIINGTALPVVEIQFPGKIYDYDAKYTHLLGETKYFCPPQKVSDELQKQAQQIALDFYHASGARDILRVDIFITSEKELFVLEGNSLPGFTSSSLVPKAALQSGMSFEKLCVTLVQNALKR
jgi:UDP-N-acetylenolpyruvoylglucosamine reductase